MFKLLSAAALSCCAIGAAQADPITKTYSIDFDFDASAPFQHVTGDFSLTFEGNLVSTGTSDGLVISGLTFPFDGPAKFVATINPAGIGSFTVGPNPSINSRGTIFCALDLSISSFCANVVQDERGIYWMSAMSYSWEGQIYRSIIATDPNPPIDPPIGVPEPAAWAMMIGGFGLAGAGLRARRTRVAFA